MKKYAILTVLAMFSYFAGVPQINEPLCGTQSPTSADPKGVYSKSIDPALLDTFEPVVYNIFFWGVLDDSQFGGYSANPITEEAVLEAVANLNIAFNPYNIFFKYTGFDTFISHEYYIYEENIDHWRARSYLKNNGLYKDDAFNVIVPYDIENATAMTGYFTNTISVQSVDLTTAGVMAHEMGHCFNLIHTFNNWDVSNSPVPENNCEHVTRTQGAIDYNADTNGDRVIDTAAQRPWYPIQNCVYTGNFSDCRGTPYEIFEVDVKNFMGYAGVRTCADRFSTGQVIRMREAILQDPNEDGEITAAQTTVASLYEPYSGEYNNSSPGSSPLFQPGFDYEFVECCCDYTLPSDYTDISFTFNASNVLASFDVDETNYSSIIHPNHSAIRIAQIPDPTGNLYQPRRCYDNNPEGPIGGTITQFNDGTFTTNVTSWKVDAAQITSERYLNSLPKGLYKIELEYPDGSIEQKVVFKREDNE